MQWFLVESMVSYVGGAKGLFLTVDIRLREGPSPGMQHPPINHPVKSSSGKKWKEKERDNFYLGTVFQKITYICGGTSSKPLSLVSLSLIFAFCAAAAFSCIPVIKPSDLFRHFS